MGLILCFIISSGIYLDWDFFSRREWFPNKSACFYVKYFYLNNSKAYKSMKQFKRFLIIIRFAVTQLSSECDSHLKKELIERKR